MDMTVFIAFIEVILAPAVSDSIYYYSFFLSSPEIQF